MVRIVLSAAALTGVMQDRVRLAVDDHGAGAAESRAAAEFGPDHPQFVAQSPEQRHFGLNVDSDFPPIHKKVDHRPAASVRRTLMQQREHDCGWLGRTEVKLARGERFKQEYRSPSETKRRLFRARRHVSRSRRSSAIVLG